MYNNTCTNNTTNTCTNNTTNTCTTNTTNTCTNNTTNTCTTNTTNTISITSKTIKLVQLLQPVDYEQQRHERISNCITSCIFYYCLFTQFNIIIILL